MLIRSTQYRLQNSISTYSTCRGGILCARPYFITGDEHATNQSITHVTTGWHPPGFCVWTRSHGADLDLGCDECDQPVTWSYHCPGNVWNILFIHADRLEPLCRINPSRDCWVVARYPHLCCRGPSRDQRPTSVVVAGNLFREYDHHWSRNGCVHHLAIQRGLCSRWF